MCVCVCMCVYVCVYVCVCMCVRVCVYVHGLSTSLDPDAGSSCLPGPPEPEVSVVDLQAKCQKLQKEITEVRGWMRRRQGAK